MDEMAKFDQRPHGVTIMILIYRYSDNMGIKTEFVDSFVKSEEVEESTE